MGLILGIESSCDECSASVVDYDALGESNSSQEQFKVQSLSTFSQIELHQPFGGVVPEVASRNHLEQIEPVIAEALSEAGVKLADLDAIAVTHRPGLIGALLVGVTAAKALAYSAKKPLVPVHHLEGHLISAFLERAPNQKPIEFPAVFLLVSGGHTNLHWVEHPPKEWPTTVLQDSLMGRSIDDAAGEAFDKTAKVMGFPYPGGKWIDENAAGGNPAAFTFPRGLKNIGEHKHSLDFSFSGVKTAVMLQVQKLEAQKSFQAEKANLCASVQEAIIDSLLTKTFLLARQKPTRSIVIVGGVSANSRLRSRLSKESPVPVHYPNLKYCTDNGAMIAAIGALRFSQGHGLKNSEFLRLNAYAF
jgi:N6-L-threonylcarbamoyladenine synthase